VVVLPETIDLTGYWFGIPKTYLFVALAVTILLLVLTREEDLLYL
jgi:hypothetical protein